MLSKPERNPRDINAISFRNVRQLEPLPTREKVKKSDVTDPIMELEESEKPMKENKIPAVSLRSVEPPSYIPSVPFPQRLTKSKTDKHFRHFIDMLRKLSITLPLIEVMTQIPTYVKFMKDILTNKRKIN